VHQGMGVRPEYKFIALLIGLLGLLLLAADRIPVSPREASTPRLERLPATAGAHPPAIQVDEIPNG